MYIIYVYYLCILFMYIIYVLFMHIIYAWELCERVHLRRACARECVCVYLGPLFGTKINSADLIQPLASIFAILSFI